MALAACSSPGAGGGDRPLVRVAFLQDLSIPSHVDLVSPSFLSFDLALHRSVEEGGIDVEIEVVQMDTEGDAERALEFADEVVDDPSYVAAVVAPFWSEPPQVASALAGAGVPTFSLSPQSPSPEVGTQGLWRRFVPDASLQVSALADAVEAGMSGAVDEARGGRVCIGAEDWPASIELQRDLDETLAPEIPRVMLSEETIEPALEDEAGCSLVVWTGAPEGAEALTAALDEAGAGSSVDLASDAMKTVIPPTVPTHEGEVPRVLTCPCVDVTTARTEAARRFVNAYQAENGLAPGIYAAEAWDAATVLGGVLTAGARDRAAVAEGLAGIEATVGVARSYAFDEAGEMVDPRVDLYAAAGSRWLPIAA